MLGISILLRRNFLRCITVIAAGQRKYLLSFTSSFDFSFSLFPFRSSLFWSKNSMDKLIISSSVIILLSSSATSPLSSLEPLAASADG